MEQWGPESWVGEWEGDSRTWFDPKGEVFAGKHKGRFTRIVGGLFLEEDYEAYIGEKLHSGKRIWGFQGDRLSCYWLDSFHTGPKAMLLDGGREGVNYFARGAYEAEGQGYGWRIEVSGEGDRLSVKHYNIMPSGQVDLAVETQLKRR